MFSLFDPRYAAVGMAQPSQIASRLSAILDERRSQTMLTRQGALGLTLAALAALLPLAAVRVGAKPPAAAGSKPIFNKPILNRSGSMGETASPALLETDGTASEAVSATPSIPYHRAEAVLRPRVAPAGYRSDENATPSAQPQASGIAWGKVEGGLQAGIGFTEKRTSYTIGELVEVNVYVRNAGKKPTTFSWQSAPQFSHSSLILPTLTGPKGKEEAYTVGGPIEKPTRTKQLQPDETVEVSHTQLHTGYGEGGGHSFGLEPMVQVTPGKQQIRQSVRIKPEGSADFSVELTSGPLEFEALSSVTRAAWGKSVEGLQAGLSFISDRRRFLQGDTVTMDLYWRNAGNHNITITYAQFYDYDYMPGVVNAKGERVEVRQVAPRLIVPKETVTLKPGESIHIGMVNLVLAEPQKADKGVGIYPEMAAIPGKYRVSQFTFVQPEAGAPVDKSGIPLIKASPITGELEFEVAEK
ncbi:MAG TPA: hypothetical protein VKU00_12390 [Chthonomonadaceae bacterium]|nr:hypothetical protein [Chthonomonadaceae bacterium]